MIIMNKYLLELQKNKNSSVILSMDLNDTGNILQLIEQVGEYIIGIKLHNDIIDGFNDKFINDILNLKKKYNFVIIEDRKFCDIGSIIEYQSEKIMKYADIVTVHSVAGQSTIDGLRKNALLNNCLLLLIAQMSSNNNLIDNEYTKKTIELANNNKDIVLGFICQEKLDDKFLHFAPGISNIMVKDGMNQNYNSSINMLNKGIDFLIIGRSIYNNENPVLATKSYIPKYNLLMEIINAGIFKKGNFRLKSGLDTDIYADFRITNNYPILLKKISIALSELINFTNLTNKEFVICGVPLGAIPYSLLISQHLNISHIILRDTKKGYGTNQLIEGKINCKNVILIEDVITSGSSIENTIKLLEEADLCVKQIIVIFDRESGGLGKLIDSGYNIVSLFKMSDLNDFLIPTN